MFVCFFLSMSLKIATIFPKKLKQQNCTLLPGSHVRFILIGTLSFFSGL